MAKYKNVKIIGNVPLEKKYFEIGDVGENVKDFQNKLIKLGYSCGPDGADGEFGPNTLFAVKQFQEEYGLEIDGLVGKDTLAALEEALNKKETPVTATIYRIRKSWTEPKTQIGAFTKLERAIESWNHLPSGYYIFDNNGNCVYPKDAIIDKKENKFKPIVLPARQYADVALGMASKDENARYSGGSAGDQSGKEVYILNTWYNQNWTSVLRPLDNTLAEKIAQAMEAACENPNIGYDQGQRNSLYTEAKKVNMNLALIKTPCECDCSSLVSICCICAGLPANIFYAGMNMRTTWDLEDACLMTGKFVNLTEPKYLTQKDYLKRGDILLNRNQHVVVVLGNGKYSESVTNPDAAIYKVKVDVKVLNVRSNPSPKAIVTGRLYKDEVYTITAVEGGWGKLKSGKGWINLEFVSQV